jgi:hypothetical protein
MAPAKPALELRGSRAKNDLPVPAKTTDFGTQRWMDPYFDEMKKAMVEIRHSAFVAPLVCSNATTQAADRLLEEWMTAERAGGAGYLQGARAALSKPSRSGDPSMNRANRRAGPRNALRRADEWPPPSKAASAITVNSHCLHTIADRVWWETTARAARGRIQSVDGLGTLGQ